LKMSKGKHVPHSSSGGLLHISTTVSKANTWIFHQLPHHTAIYSLVNPLSLYSLLVR
jgi:hypothetical protein